MVAISKSFTVIADGDIDPDSPITTGLMTELRDNDIHLREWIGASFFAGAEQDHDHDGVNSAAVAVGSLFASALFNLSTSGTTTVGTGALAFEPKVVLVVGLLDATSSAEDSLYVGFATGTGVAARSVAHRTGSGTGFSVDADSIGGRASATAGAASHLSDLDVTTFSKAGGIVFQPSSSTGTWTFKVLVFGFTA